MTWDLFSSAEQARREAERAMSNEALAHAVAAARAEPGVGAQPRAGDEWSVSRVNAAAREMVEAVFPPLWVVGEVANFTRARSGHCYFTLRDADAQLRCVMWREEARRLPTPPAEGMQVRALGRLSLYEPRGEFQLVVSELEGRGDGLWKLALDRLRVKLEAEGLTSPERKRVLPRHPVTVGVVTSPSGAVLHDIATVVRRRAPWTRIVLAGCRVQGEGAAEEIAAAIRLLAGSGCADVLIVGRGGGSVEDLWAFNEEVVARAIAESPVPVISAVGHETDVTIADLVADLRAPTPSAAAEAAVPDGAALRLELRRVGQRIAGAVREQVQDGRAAVQGSAARLASVIERRVLRDRERLGHAGRRLHALSPLGAFDRGFALPLDSRGRILRRAEEFLPGDVFDLRVRDGVVACRVEADGGAPAKSGAPLFRSGGQG